MDAQLTTCNDAERKAQRPGPRERWQTENFMSKSKDATPGSLERLVRRSVMVRTTYAQRYDGDSFRIPWKNWVMRCCDCGLVHRMRFELRGKQLWVRPLADPKRTKNARRRGNWLCRPNDSVLSDYPPMTAHLRYRDGSGKVKDWFIGADPKRDNEETLRSHLHKHLPAAELVAWAIK